MTNATERQIVNNTGQTWGKLKMAERFDLAWEQEGIGGDLEAEYVFDAERRWRFDRCFPSQRLAIEFDGAGRHQMHYGRRGDFEKRNEAVRQGWRVLVYESSMLALCRMLDIVCDVIDCLAPPVEDALPDFAESVRAACARISSTR